MKILSQISLYLLLTLHCVSAQNINSISGTVIDKSNGKPVSGVKIEWHGNKILSGSKGAFIIRNLPSGETILTFSYKDHITKKIPVIIRDTTAFLDLESVYMETSERVFKEQLISLRDEDLSENENGLSDNITGLLTASKDIFQKTAAYEFSQTFFRPRSLGNEYSTVRINGVSMNKLYNGRPQWSNWGGLNDVLRNQIFSENTQASPTGFNDLGGNLNMITLSSAYRKGFKFSYAASNRTYKNRLMATYSSGLLKNGWAFTVSASTRFADEGYREGTVYKATSFFAAIEKQFNQKHSLCFTGIYAHNIRGKSSPVTQEVFDLKNNRYNAYWGVQEGVIRNSRVRNILEPVFQLTHSWNISPESHLQTSITYQTGYTGNSRLDYGGTRLITDGQQHEYIIGNGRNPAPDYYQKLPGYFLRNPDHPDYTKAYLSEQAFIQNGQIDWNELYDANRNLTKQGSNSVYALYEDRNDDRQITVNSIFFTKLNSRFSLNAAVSYTMLRSENFANMLDLLGGNGFLDVDRYAENIQEAQNDLRNPNKIIKEQDHFKYSFLINAAVLNGFLQTNYHNRKFDAYAAVKVTNTQFQRNGLYENGAYPGNASFGESEKLSFLNYGFKAGLTYKLSGRHLFQCNAAWLTKAPGIKNSFSNIRENNAVVTGLTDEKHLSIDLSYHLRYPGIRAKISAYWIALEDQTHIAFYFADGLTGLNRHETTAFVQEVLTGIGKQNYGLEFGFEFPVMIQWKIKGVAAVGQSVYTRNPELYLTSDSFKGILNYGKASLKNYFVPNGPQQAYSFGFEYNSTNYWWFSATGNYFRNAYLSIAPITRTSNFYMDTDGMPIPDYDEEIAYQLLKQEIFKPYFLINMVGGKSWKIHKYYLGFFASINNVLNATYKTGGYEQARNASYHTLLEDQMREKPLFGPKYWFGYGTSYYASVYFRW